MYCMFARIAVVLAICLASSLAVSEERLVLNGAHQYSKLNVPVYVGGLYLPQKSSDPNYALSENHSKKMRVVVLDDVWRPNSWRRYWREAIAVNNPAEVDDERVYDALGAFTELAQDKLEKGDEIEIAYNGQTTSVRLNGELAITIQGDDVFNILLKTWLGDVPPSSAFRSAILSGSTQKNYAGLGDQLSEPSYSKERASIFSQWQAQKERNQRLKRQRAEEEARLLAEQQAREREQAEKAKKAAQELADLTREAKKQPRGTSVAGLDDERKKQAALKVRRENEQKRFLTEFITWQIQRYVNKHARYPMWAERFGEEGLVRLPFTFNPEGTIVFSNSAGDDESMLVKEIKQQVQNSLDQISIPSGMLQTPQMINVSYLFSLIGKENQVLIKPEVPEHMLEKGVTPSESVEAIKEYYRAYVSKQIINTVEYPEAARMLRQWGKVSADLTVNNWGEVKEVTLTGRSRHKLLNEAIETAVSDVAPFKPFPLQIFNEPHIEISIDYTFR